MKYVDTEDFIDMLAYAASRAPKAIESALYEICPSGDYHELTDLVAERLQAIVDERTCEYTPKGRMCSICHKKGRA